MPSFTLETLHHAHSWEELCADFRWEVPARFNLGWDCCGQHALDSGRVALYFEREGWPTATYTFLDIQRSANRLSNALRALGVQRADRVAIVLPQCPETAIAHIAVYQLGGIA